MHPHNSSSSELISACSCSSRSRKHPWNLLRGTRSIRHPEKAKELEMKSKLLLSTAVLLATVGISSAQNAPGGGVEHGRGVESHGAQSTPMRSEQRGGEMKGQQGAQENHGVNNNGVNHGLPAGRAQSEHSPQTTGQAPQREQVQRQGQHEERNQPQHTERNQPGGAANQGQQPQRSGQRSGEDTGKDRTTGQAPPQQNAPGRASQNPNPSVNSGANPSASPSAAGESHQQQGQRNPDSQRAWPRPGSGRHSPWRNAEQRAA